MMATIPEDGTHAPSLVAGHLASSFIDSAKHYREMVDVFLMMELGHDAQDALSMSRRCEQLASKWTKIALDFRMKEERGVSQ